MKSFVLAIVAMVFAIQVKSQTDTRIKHFNVEKGLAIQGYDPVAYFLQNKAIKGNMQFAATVEGIIYHFSNAANKNLFVKDPKKYEPQYGGWCAYAMGANNEKVAIDPETFKIVSGKLYLFYHSWVNNTLTKWNKDEATLKPKADANWATKFK